MTSVEKPEPQGWRVLGFGKHPENAAAIQRRLQSEGLRARNFALTDDQDGDDQLIRELTGATYDAVAIGGFINGQDPEIPQPNKPRSGSTESSTSSTPTLPRRRSSSSALRPTPYQQSSACSEPFASQPRPITLSSRRQTTP